MSSAFYALYKIVKFLIYPLTWMIVLLSLALFWSWRRNQLRLRISVALALLVAYLLSIPPVGWTLAYSLERRYPLKVVHGTNEPFSYDAVVVLGGGVSRKGGLRSEDRLTHESLERLLCARELMLQGVSSMMILSGGNANPDQIGTPVSLVMEKALKSLGAGNWTVMTETDSRTTYENAAEIKKRLRPQSRIALVTSALHMPRAMALFQQQGLDVNAFPCGFTAGLLPTGMMRFMPDVGYLRQSTLAISEWIGLFVYRLSGYA